MSFPKDFVWATAASHYQVEGGGTLNGRGESTWDAIRNELGRIKDGSKPKDSIEGYDRWKEDIQLIKSLGVSHYRFSLDWSRILPKGTTEVVNDEGIQYYRSFINGLIEADIQPMITLFHFDWPLVLFDQGGWKNPLSQKWFNDFCDLCFQMFGDLVKFWMTFNEIGFHVLSAVCKLEVSGEPFHCPTRPEPEEGDAAILVANHNMLLAHAIVYRNFERVYKPKFGGKCGIVTGGQGLCVGEDEAINSRATDFNLGWNLDPIMFGDYPESMKRRLTGEKGTPKLPVFTEEEKALLKGSTDFLGINYYLPRLVGSGTGGSLLERLGEYRLLENNWEKIGGEDSWCRNYPEGLLKMFRLYRDKYGNIPTLVTENGCGDYPGSGIEDNNRIKLITEHVAVVQHALSEGCNVFGYTVWCLLDNFEWDDGFGARFGLYRIDHLDPEKKRVPKKSVAFYRDLIKRHNKFN